jgi:plastocyanin
MKGKILNNSSANPFDNSMLTNQPGRNKLGVTRLSAISRWILLLAVLIVPQVVQAQWSATVGAQSNDKGFQALAFLPNEIWIHAGDRITWTFDADEIHTLTFLTADQPRPFFAAGCPGFSTDPATYDGSTCVTTPPMVKGQTFTVIFPVAGNFKLVCLVHENMDGRIHVLDLSEPLPHDQAFYDKQAASQRRELLSDARSDAAAAHALPNSRQGVTAGAGEVTARAGGSSTVSALRFSDDNIQIHAGQTVEWDNQDPVTPHTITFGPEPEDLVDPSPDVTVDPDGARHAIIDSTSDSTHSGFIVAAPQERLGLPQAPLGVTRFRVTFPNAGTFPYICALHDDLGMTGQVTVSP